jgi:hypothetical protein
VAAVLLGLLAFVALDLTVLQANLLFGASLLSGATAITVLEKLFPAINSA